MEKLEAVRELHTAVATIQTVVSAEEARECLGISLGAKKMLYVAVGQVRAGVDLRKLEPEAVKVVDGRLVVERLPPAQLLDVKIDLARSHVYDVQRRLWAPAAVHLQSRLQRMAHEEIRKAALEAGVLELAEDQARRALALLD